VLEILTGHQPIVDDGVLDGVGLGLRLCELALHGNDNAVHQPVEPSNQLRLSNAQGRRRGGRVLKAYYKLAGFGVQFRR